MILHGLAKAGRHLPWPSEELQRLALVALQRPLDPRRPLQAAQLLEAFVRLRHDADAVLSAQVFGACQAALPRWDAAALTALCGALGRSRRAARAPLEAWEQRGENGWGRLARRCAEVIPEASAWQLASLAHYLGRVGAPKEELEPFYDALEAGS